MEKSKSAKRRKEAVRNTARRRRILIAALGGECVICGETTNLEFDHISPRKWKARELSRWSRQLAYEKDWEAGRLRLLCATCNKVSGAPDDVPF